MYCNLINVPSSGWTMTELKYTQTQSSYVYLNSLQSLCQLYTWVCTPTYSEYPTHPLTYGGTLCRHTEVVGSASFKVLREVNGGILAHSGGVIPVYKVGVRRVGAIVNGAGVPWLKRTLHKSILYVHWVNIHPKNIHATCGEWWVMHVSEWWLPDWLLT